MCEAGVNIKAMQEIPGHADADTTMDIYAEAFHKKFFIVRNQNERGEYKYGD